MDDPPLVTMVDGVANLREQRQTLAGREPSVARKVGDRPGVRDVLHGEVWHGAGERGSVARATRFNC